MKCWTMFYSTSRGGITLPTGISAKNPEEAWLLWGPWRNHNKVWLFHHVFAQEVEMDDLFKSPTSAKDIWERQKDRMTHLTATPSTPTPAKVWKDGVTVSTSTQVPVPSSVARIDELLAQYKELVAKEAMPPQEVPVVHAKDPKVAKSYSYSGPQLPAKEIWPEPTETETEKPFLSLVPPLPKAAQAEELSTLDPYHWPATCAFDRGDDMTMYNWVARALSGYKYKKMSVQPNAFLRGTKDELTAIWVALGASVHPEAKANDLHSCYIRGKWMGMIRQDVYLHPGTYITTLPSKKELES